MKTIKSIINRVKASRLTYYNVDKKTIEDFKRLYSYLKKHEGKYVSTFTITIVDGVLKDKYISDYVRKYKAMQILSAGIKH